jgi:hypothetical protein
MHPPFNLGRSGRGDVVGSFDKVDFFFLAANLHWKFLSPDGYVIT